MFFWFSIVSIPKRVSEALKPINPVGVVGANLIVSIPKRVSEALKHQKH